MLHKHVTYCIPDSSPPPHREFLCALPLVAQVAEDANGVVIVKGWCRMATNVVQEGSFSKATWSVSSAHHQQATLATCSLTEPGLLDETIEVVKEKVWSFRNAWKGFADVFSKVGVSPTVFGYSSVPLHEDDYVKEHSEDVLALAKVDAEDDKPSSKRPTLLLIDGTVLEEDNLLNEEGDLDEDVDHAFAESSRKEFVEKRSLTRSAG
ncbi:hypothetical protein GOP47_0006537 [Adiantum capillus-veneris]|uniref:Uncharacterized protein n=1 Tax=Adiantum capillus-veneris TaxID=13818 RepID=A0A9D4ZMK8_ADICA|nr:hypothetical protein GOP47_0006537 [Adiantum capillus-veneris]